MPSGMGSLCQLLKCNLLLESSRKLYNPYHVMHSKPSYFPPEDATKNLCRSYVSPAYQDLGLPLWSIPSPHTAANKLAPMLTGDMLIPARSALSLSVRGAPASRHRPAHGKFNSAARAPCRHKHPPARPARSPGTAPGPAQARADHHSAQSSSMTSANTPSTVL